MSSSTREWVPSTYAAVAAAAAELVAAPVPVVVAAVAAARVAVAGVAGSGADYWRRQHPTSPSSAGSSWTTSWPGARASRDDFKMEHVIMELG